MLMTCGITPKIHMNAAAPHIKMQYRRSLLFLHAKGDVPRARHLMACGVNMAKSMQSSKMEMIRVIIR